MNGFFDRFMNRFLSIIFLVGILIFISAIPAAASGGQVLEIPPDLWSWIVNLVLVQWPSLVGVAALIAMLIDIGKSAGWLQDGVAPKWSAGLNLAGMVALIAFKIFKPMLTTEIIDAQAGIIASVLLVVSGYVLMIITSRQTHRSLAGVPYIGKSFSLTTKG
jgi:hypothetical protein